MTNAMIWTFGLLAFFLLLVGVSRWSPGGRQAGRYRKLSEQTVQTGQQTVHRLDQIGLQLGEVQTQVTALQRVLRDVE